MFCKVDLLIITSCNIKCTQLDALHMSECIHFYYMKTAGEKDDDVKI